MKKTFFIITIIAMVFSSCKKDEDYEFKSGEMVYINGIDQPKFKNTEKQYTVSEIVRNPEVRLAIYTYNHGVYKWTSRVFIKNAREQIINLYKQERYDEIYELFHTAFVFYPCNGEEYKQILNGNGYSYYQEKYDYEYDEN